MATTIQVILREDMENVGASGELVKVRPGFARNFLLPRGHAVPATTAQINRINHEKAVAVVRNEKLRKEAQEVATKIEGLKIKIARPVGEDDKLFGSVTAKDIHTAAVAAGATFDRKKMHLAEPIRTIGTFEVPVKLLPGLTAKLKVEIVAK
jgi:large subunit ribosomal protein L9